MEWNNETISDLLQSKQRDWQGSSVYSAVLGLIVGCYSYAVIFKIVQKPMGFLQAQLHLAFVQPCYRSVSKGWHRPPIVNFISFCCKATGLFFLFYSTLLQLTRIISIICDFIVLLGTSWKSTTLMFTLGMSSVIWVTHFFMTSDIMLVELVIARFKHSTGRLALIHVTLILIRLTVWLVFIETLHLFYIIW